MYNDMGKKYTLGFFLFAGGGKLLGSYYHFIYHSMCSLCS